MNDRTFDHLLDAWMDLGPTAAPVRVADAARLEARTTRQTAIPPWWPPRRFSLMNTYAKVAVAVAAVTVAALVGYSYFIAPNVGGPSVPSEPTPEASVNAVDFTDFEGMALEPGPLRIDYAAPVVVTITIPDEPYLGYPSAWYKAQYDWGPWHQSNRAILGFMDVGRISANPCAGGFEPEDAVGPAADDLAAAIEQIVGIDVVRSDATIDGYSGLALEVTGSSDRPTECAEEPVMWLTNKGDIIPMPDAGESLQVWILDVDGERLVVSATADAEGLYADELDALFESIQIEGP